MPKKQDKRTNEFKYGCPLYGAVWPPGSHYFVCGGGGHGLVDRIVWATYRDGVCSDEQGSYKLGKFTPMRMALAPSATTLIVGGSDGGVRRFQMDLRSGKPHLIEVSAAFAERCSVLRDEVKAMAFDELGSRLAVGFATGAVKVLEYPSMRLLQEWSLLDGVKDMDMCHARLYGELTAQQLTVATVSERGECQVWDVDRKASVVTLPPPRSLSGTLRFTRCRWSRGGGEQCLYTVVQQGREASYLAVYRLTGKQAGPGGWRCDGEYVMLERGPNAALEISSRGHYLAAGQTGGRLKVLDAATLRTVADEPNASMVFITAVAFSADEQCALAVAGDANTFVLDLHPNRTRSRRGRTWTTLLFTLLLIALAFLAFLHTPPQHLPDAAVTWQQVAWQHSSRALEACEQWFKQLTEHVPAVLNGHTGPWQGAEQQQPQPPLPQPWVADPLKGEL